MNVGILDKLGSRKTTYNPTVTAEDGLVLLDDVTRKELQKVLLCMYKDIYSVCRKYNIVPYLVGGSALGAVRHHGFIPWDDDLDIGMTREDYLILRRHFKEELGWGYILNAPNYSHNPKARFPKIMKKGTLCRDLGDQSDPENCGVFVDVFILEDIPESRVKCTIKGLLCNGLEFIAGQVALMENNDERIKEGIKNEGKLVSLIRRTTGTVFKIIPSGSWYNGIDKVARGPKGSSLAGFPTGRKHYFGEILPKEVYFPPRYIDFCGIEVPVFNKVETHLSTLYGDDYMEIPPLSKRERHLFVELKF